MECTRKYFAEKPFKVCKCIVKSTGNILVFPLFQLMSILHAPSGNSINFDNMNKSPNVNLELLKHKTRTKVWPQIINTVLAHVCQRERSFSAVVCLRIKRCTTSHRNSNPIMRLQHYGKCHRFSYSYR